MYAIEMGRKSTNLGEKNIFKYRKDTKFILFITLVWERSRDRLGLEPGNQIFRTLVEIRIGFLKPSRAVSTGSESQNMLHKN